MKINKHPLIIGTCLTLLVGAVVYLSSFGKPKGKNLYTLEGVTIANSENYLPPSGLFRISDYTFQIYNKEGQRKLIRVYNSKDVSKEKINEIITSKGGQNIRLKSLYNLEGEVLNIWANNIDIDFGIKNQF
jgi:hypothetical protein